MESEADFLKALAEPTRLRLAVLLSGAGESCVCVLARALDAPDYGVSRHLSVLRAAGIVEARREGTWMYYRLARSRSAMEECVYKCFTECFNDDSVARDDMEKLKAAQVELCGAPDK